MIALTVFFWLLTESTPKQTGNVVVNIEGLRNDKGKVAVAIFNGADGFPSKPDKILQGKITDITNRKAKAVFENLPFGAYAVVFIHDENENRDLDTNFIGIPVEGYGVSNNPRFFFGPPKFVDAAFQLDAPEIVIDLKAKYLL